MMLGYLLLAATLILFLFYTYQHLRRFLRETKKGQEDVEKGYYLLSHTYEDQEKASYYGVFQQGDCPGGGPGRGRGRRAPGAGTCQGVGEVFSGEKGNRMVTILPTVPRPARNA